MEKQYYNHINLLRGIAAVMVCVFHFSNFNSAHGALFSEGSFTRESGYFGYLGVFVFFVLSGFVIPLSLQNSSFRLKDFHLFLGRRYVRIEIPYVASILLVLLVAFIFSRANHTGFEVDPARFVSHLFYTVPFTHHVWYNEIYWTLSIEIQFYILIAIVFFLLNRNVYLTTTTLIGLLTIGCLFTDDRFIFHYMPFFGAGMVCWLYKKKKYPYPLLFILMLVCVGTGFYIFKYYEAIVIILSVVFILGVPEMKNQNFLIGKISYSLYLTHGVIGGNLIYFLVGKISSFAIFFGGLAVSIVFAYIFYRIVERPSLKLSKRIQRNAIK